MKYRMVDQILAWEPWQSMRGIKAVSFEEYTAKLRLGADPALPPLLMLESALQLARWLVVASSDFRSTLLPLSLDHCRWTGHALGPGERLAIDLAVHKHDHGSISLNARGRISQAVVMEIDDLTAEFLPLADHDDPADLRVLFSELHRPNVAEVA